MISTKLILALLAGTFVAAQEIERNDIPQDCRAICEPVLEITRRCDRANNDNDQRERDCICEAANGPAFATCNECTLRFPQYFVDTDNDDDNDVNDNDDNEVNLWNSRCAFGGNSSTTGTGTITAAPTATSSVSMSTGVFTTTVCDDDAFEDPNDDDVCVTRVVTGVVPVAVPAPTTDASGNTITPSSTTGGSTGTQTTQTTQTTQAGQTGASSSSSSFDGGAMATAIPMLGAGAGMVLAALAAI